MKENMKGFTLIELMIVVAIIGILAAIAIPNFLNYQCKARQSEAKTNLASVATAQESYFAENGAYSSSKTAIGFETKGTSSYTITTTGSASHFTASATTADLVGGKTDTWVVSDVKSVSYTSSACN